MLEDVTGEGAMRLEEAIRRKRARPDDESSRTDMAMELAARNPIPLVQYGGSSSSWEARPEPSRRREAEEQLGGDVIRARVQDPHGVVRPAEQTQLQPREELEAPLDSICELSMQRRASLKTPCGDCWECLDWPRVKIERSKL